MNVKLISYLTLFTNLLLPNSSSFSNIPNFNSATIKPHMVSLSTNDINQWKVYINKNYGVLLKYPDYWNPNLAYSNRYDGKDGFFQISAISTQGLSIDKVAELDANHITLPYGSNPKIEKLIIDTHEARLILPSNDQSKEMNNQAEIIVKYKHPLNLDNQIYEYFVLWCDKNHINEIGSSLKFIY